MRAVVAGGRLQAVTLPIWVFVIAAAVAGSLILSSRRRSDALEQIRTQWGSPRERRRQMSAIAEYHRSRIDAPETGEALDDRTWEDLNLDAVFERFDRTESTLGQQALYHRLRSSHSAEDLAAFEALVERLRSDAPRRERAQLALARLQDPSGYDLWWVAQPDSVETRPWYVLFPVMACAMLAAIALAAVWPGALLLLIVGSVLNLTIRYVTAPRVGAVLGAFRQVGPLIALAERLREFDDGRTATLTASLRSVGELARLKRTTAWVARNPLAADDLTAALIQYLNILFLLDANALFFGARELRTRGPLLLKTIAAVGDIDAALAVASYRESSGGWTRPCFRDTPGPITMNDLTHPLVENAVPNSITLAPPDGVLVTGSNMSGKTTFLRTVGVNAVLAQTINTCLASAYEAPVFIVKSCIGRSDDLVAGTSYYLAEVESVLAIVRASATPRPHLFLFDELFRGTNAVERIAAGESVLSELLGPAKGARHLVIAATHDSELVDLLQDEYEPYHFADTIGVGGLAFEYRLEKGPATTRNAIALLRLRGAPDALVSRALQRAEILDRQRASRVAVVDRLRAQ